jgi:pimeloyl-ACP methyl ester carboxylesterase
MADLLTYALLSGRVYPSTRENRIALPTTSDWKEVQPPQNHFITGFAAGVYKKVTTDETTNETTTEVVIAFAGTDELMLQDYLAGNIPAGLGLPAAQVVQAVRLVSSVMEEYKDQDVKITLTGHSLGGGLASLMAVFFNKEAIVFDAAPFGRSARDDYAFCKAA